MSRSLSRVWGKGTANQHATGRDSLGHPETTTFPSTGDQTVAKPFNLAMYILVSFYIETLLDKALRISYSNLAAWKILNQPAGEVLNQTSIIFQLRFNVRSIGFSN